MTVCVYVVTTRTNLKVKEIVFGASSRAFLNLLRHELPETDDLDARIGRTLILDAFSPGASLTVVSFDQANYICHYLQYTVMEHGLTFTCTNGFLNLLEIFHAAIKNKRLRLYIRSEG